MKKLLLLCSALALAGCNSSPSTGDVEKFLKPKFASCENIKVVDIKKTNGYEEDGYYRVEYTYGITLKDEGQLKEMKTIWQQEQERSSQAKVAYAERDKKVAALRKQIEALEDESAPRYEQFDDGQLHHSQGISATRVLTPQEQHSAALNAWRLNPPEPLRQKQEELKAYEQAFRDQWGNYSPQFLGQVGAAVSKFYRQGCPGTSYKFTEGMLQGQAQAANQTDDLSHWFEQREIQMKGSMTMRKTENGWRALSAS
ncbi:Lipoprotein [Comamonas aquatilis]